MGLREEICSGDLRLDACDPERFRFSVVRENANYCVSRIVSLSAEALVVEGPLPNVSKTDDLLKLCGDVTIDIKEYSSDLLVSDHVRVCGHGCHLYDRKNKDGVQLRYIDIRVHKVTELSVVV